MMRIINKITGEVVADGFGTPYPTLDDAIRLVGRITNDTDVEDVEIDGKWYDYDDLDTEVY